MVVTKSFLEKRKVKLNDDYVKASEKVSKLIDELDYAQMDLENIIFELEQLNCMKHDEE
ncbi:MAG: hypothetical protein ACO3HJ_00165 [Methylophilaceae bacterium]